MKKRFSIILTLVCAMAFSSPAQLRFATAKFHMGDNPEWKALNFDDSSWKSVATDITWQGQNMLKENTCGWYRVKFVLPKSMLENSDNKSVVVFDLNKMTQQDIDTPLDEAQHQRNREILSTLYNKDRMMKLIKALPE